MHMNILIMDNGQESSRLVNDPDKLLNTGTNLAALNFMNFRTFSSGHCSVSNANTIEFH